MKQGIFIEKCRGIFSDNDGVRYIPRQKFGSALDIQRVALADAGETRIFCKAEKRQYADYQICFVMDVSGSMDGSKIDILVQACHAMSYALTVAGATVSGISFNAEVLPVTREELFNHRKLNDVLKVRLRKNGGCNRDGMAVKTAREQLSRASHSPAKIMVVFSDGQPCCGKCHSTKEELAVGQNAYLMQQVRVARANGIEVLAVDIQEGGVDRFYGKGKTVFVENLNTLYQETMSLLERNIRRG